MIFISHANEVEDNEFTRWLALRLASLGYPIWCDQTNLLGGERFWDDIEASIRERTEKFLVVLSRKSNVRDNVLKEVSVAEKVGKTKHNFIVPLRIDDLPQDDVTIELSRISSVDFSAGWAPALAQLLKSLEEDGIAKDPSRFNHDAVTFWWRNNERRLAEVSAIPEPCASNWFGISDLPESIYLYSLTEPLQPNSPRLLDLGVPNYRERGGLFSFEEPKPFAERLKGIGMELADNARVNLFEFQQYGYTRIKLSKLDARNIVTSLLKQAFEFRCASAGLNAYELSGGTNCFWFPPNKAEGDKVCFEPLSDRKRRGKPRRQMVGRALDKNGLPKKRRWHFGISAKLIRWPQLVFAIRVHVIFTEPSGDLLAAKKQHKARRSECRSWHNNTWLDRMLAAIAFLHDPDSRSFISVPCGERVGFAVSTRPLCFRSPIRFGPQAGPNDPESTESVADDDDDDDTSVEDEEVEGDEDDEDANDELGKEEDR